MNGLWMDGINYIIGIACVFFTIYFIVWLIAVLAKMCSDQSE